MQMHAPSSSPAGNPGFPRYFKIAGHWINSYKVLLCVGIYTGTLVCAAMASRAGVSPLRLGLGAMVAALLGIAGARIYHVLIFARHYARSGGGWSEVLNTSRGGLGVFGGLITVVPFSWLLAWWLDTPIALLWDCMGAGVLFGGFWIRFGCVFNGCCCGRETSGWCGVRLHDTQGVRKRRVPVQFLEMGWWLIGAGALLWLWPRAFEPGSYALGVLAWYGLGRFWMEPLRERQDLFAGKVRINQLVAALLFLGAGGVLVARAVG